VWEAIEGFSEGEREDAAAKKIWTPVAYFYT